MDAITVHPRTRAQWFHGRADWKVIGEVKRAVRIPVIGNGDVTTPYLVKRMFEETGCDGVMIGKGALGNPWIFDPENRWTIEKGTAIHPSLGRERGSSNGTTNCFRDFYGDPEAVKEVRRHVVWYTKGLPKSASFRSTILGVREKEPCLRPSIPILILRLRRNCALRINPEQTPAFKTESRRVDSVGGEVNAHLSGWKKRNKLLGCRRRHPRRESRSSLFTGQEEGSCPGAFQKGFF